MKVMKTEDFHMYRVEWMDIAGYKGWQHIDDVAGFKPLHCISVGFLLESTPERITLGLTISHGSIESGHCDEVTTAGDVMVIPLHNVVRLTELKGA